MQNRNKIRRFSWFRLCLLVAAGYCLYVVAGQQAELYRVRQESQAVNARLAEVTKENQELTTEKGNLNNPAYIEKLAREQLGMVKPGEMPYIPARLGASPGP